MDNSKYQEILEQNMAFNLYFNALHNCHLVIN